MITLVGLIADFSMSGDGVECAFKDILVPLSHAIDRYEQRYDVALESVNRNVAPIDAATSKLSEINVSQV